MKAIVAAAALLCTAVFAQENNPSFERIAEPMAPRNIQVLLEKDASEALLEIKGPYYIFNPHDGSRIASGLLGKRFIIRELDTGLKWGEEFPGIHQVYLKPRSSETTIFVNGIQYNGAIAIYGVSGTINVINDIDIESFVKAQLTAQFPSPLEPEVMSALAILARTDAYYNSTRASTSFWHVDAHDVGYQGSALVVSNSATEKAVDTTRHLILVHAEEGRNVPFAATWTENSAGKTAPYASIFRKEVFAPEKGVEAPHAALARHESKWSYQIGKKTLAHLLDISQIKSIELFMDPASNKIYGVRIKDGVDTHDIDFITLQDRLGKNHLQSSDFTVSLKDDAILFSGFGKGHGVGLCLYSASALAQNGENAVKILSKFFPETYLYNLNAIPGEIEKR
ncbi:MAG TPA: SpoIID/LytB domain-containing protein [Chlamydiales bacterium]|nr:SpoIID/LytB domain-containing protein [Chlamydiales bacterium]